MATETQKPQEKPTIQPTTAPAGASPASVQRAPYDSHGRNLEPGDVVNLRATVTAINGDKVNLRVFEPKTGDEHSISSISGNLIQHTGENPRIGAAPQLRTPVTELPAKQGGVKPVAKDEFRRDENTESTAGLPTATAAKAGAIAAA